MSSHPLRGALPALLVAVLLLRPGSSLSAQEVERQVPVDSTLGLVEITPEIRRELGLFPEVERFEAARLFATAQGRFVLEITSEPRGRLTRERRIMAPEEVARFRSELARRVAVRGGAVARSSEGRGGLVLGETLLGLGFYGPVLPIVFDVDSDRGAVAAYLLTAGASFYLPYRLTRNRSVTDTHRRLTLYGATRGALLGGTLGSLIEGDHGDERVYLGLAMAASVAGSLAGFGAARPSVSEGKAALWSTMGDFGFAFGFGAAAAAGFYDRESVIAEGGFSDERYVNLRAGHALGLLGAAGGLATGYWLGEREDYTVGDATVLRSSGLLGAQLALPVANVLGGDDEGPYMTAALSGAALGIVAGNRLLRPEAFSPSQGLLVAAGQLAGGLSALGLTYLLSSGADDLAYLTTSALGSAAGFALTFRALRRPSR